MKRTIYATQDHKQIAMLVVLIVMLALVDGQVRR
jgi:hypothetical protein